MRSPAAMVLLALVSMAAAIASSAPAAYAAAAGVPPSSAPWVPIGSDRIGSFFYRQVANFSLLIHALVFREYLDLLQVVSGSVQAAGAGNNYSLLIRVRDEQGGVRRYQTVVWGVPGSRDWTWKVERFDRVPGN